MFGKEKKPKKPKSKARKIIEWVLTGLFTAAIIGVIVVQIINKTSKNQFALGPQYQKVLTDSMSPVYKVNDIIVVEKTSPEDLYKRVNEKHEDVDLSFKWDVNGEIVSMTHRLISVTYSETPFEDRETHAEVHYVFVAHGINKESEWCKGTGGYMDCTGQTQTFNELAIIGRVTRKSPIMTFATSIWGLLVMLLIPCIYLIVVSVFDIVKALDDKEETAAEGAEGGEVVGETVEPANKDPLAGLSDKEKEKLKKQMLDEMLGKKK